MDQRGEGDGRPADGRPIGIFDSGVGGLTVLKAIRALLPAEPLAYVADQAHLPYGPRPAAELRAFAEGIAGFLLQRGSKLLVVACNTASAAALHSLRALHPRLPIAGLEPAVRPAAAASRSGVIGVLATPATLQGALYGAVVRRFAGGLKVLEHPCSGLVEQIEKGELDSQATREILSAAIGPMLAQGADALVLGCTHYPLVIPLIREIAGPQMRILEPAPAVARQVARLLEKRGLSAAFAAASPAPPARLYTTGDPARLRSLLPRLLGEQTGEQAPVTALRWAPSPEAWRLEAAGGAAQEP
jgi:glutamate racemase